LSYRAVVMGCSAGGMQAVAGILQHLPSTYRLPLLLVQHLHKEQGEYMLRFYSRATHLTVQEAQEKEKICPGHLYLAPPDYHLLVEQDETFSLSVEEKVNYSRPSIDVLFESAADVYGPELIALILSGANNDGALGLKRIKEQGGLILVQDPSTAQFPEMPKSVLRCTSVDHVGDIETLAAIIHKAASRSLAW
jgi:two-component system, chemotaxis family, protein-glutamate methylesterase/glutaminase